jgi:hypothetical protein
MPEADAFLVRPGENGGGVADPHAPAREERSSAAFSSLADPASGTLVASRSASTESDTSPGASRCPVTPAADRADR